MDSKSQLRVAFVFAAAKHHSDDGMLPMMAPKKITKSLNKLEIELATFYVYTLPLIKVSLTSRTSLLLVPYDALLLPHFTSLSLPFPPNGDSNPACKAWIYIYMLRFFSLSAQLPGELVGFFRVVN